MSEVPMSRFHMQMPLSADPTRLVIFGSRKFTDLRLMAAVLYPLEPMIKTVISGCHPDIIRVVGVDDLAKLWANAHCKEHLAFPVDWNRRPDGSYDKFAGPVRNEQMITVGRPTAGMAFPGNTGTANMTELCKRYGIPLIVVTIQVG